MSVDVEMGQLDGADTFVLRSDWLEAEVAHSVGGRITRLLDRKTGQDLLWRNRALPLRREQPGAPYDPAFYGGIDELLPNDGAEVVDGVDWPDHGELWTAPLKAQVLVDGIRLTGWLPRCGLRYDRTMRLLGGAPCLENVYAVTNESEAPRRFIWRMHAALAISPGSLIECPAETARALDPAFTRRPGLDAFRWPSGADVVPAKDGSGEFVVLEKLGEGRAALLNAETGIRFTYTFDLAVFPCVVVFASYGGLFGHYTAVLEPCTCPCMSIAEACATGKSVCLEPGESLRTGVQLAVESV